MVLCTCGTGVRTDDVAVRTDDVAVTWQVTWMLTGWDTVAGHGGGWADVVGELAVTLA